jgi:hypothetical protein
MPVAIDAAIGGTSPILYGADKIGKYLFPNESPQRRLRRVYHLTSEVRQTDRLPTFKMGGVLCARPAVIEAWISEREGRTAA